ncbi:MAG: metallophosphoesterase [Nannocystaceae bacterium]
MAKRPYNPKRSYRPELDVRAWDDIAELLGDSEPHGLFWPLVGPRRSGKTWALHGVAARLDAPAQLLRLDQQPELGSDLAARPIVLVDEPGRHLFTPGEVGRGRARAPDRGRIGQFLTWCRRLRQDRRQLLVAMTPAEWAALCLVGRENALVSERDLQPHLAPLRLDQAVAVARGDAEAEALLRRIAARSPDWLRNPYLVWHLLDRAQQEGRLRAAAHAELDALFASASAAANATGSDNYTHMVLYEGLAAPHQEALRLVTRGRAGEAEPAALAILRTSGLIGRAEGDPDGAREGIRDPLLAAHLPPPLRIHHISDLHAGPKTALRVNQAQVGPTPTKLAEGAGQGSVRESYREHVAQLRQRGDGPHLIVASGDLTETGRPEEYAEARALLEALAALASPHPDLAADAPRVLVVGGNHDVDWQQTRGADGARARHLPFARELDGFPRPPLEEPPERRKLATVTYADAGLEVILLGSAEFGGEIDELLVELLDDLRAKVLADAEPSPAGRAPDELQRLRDRLSRLDPGLVHNEDLSRLRGRPKVQPLRIAVLHHPVSPLPATTDVAPYAGLINAGAVKDALFEAGVDLVLHGHMHSAWLAEERWVGRARPLRIAAAPSLSSRLIHEAHGYNEILLYREGDDHFQLEVRAIARSGESWSESAALAPFPAP